jgi:alpha,alpha-trehalase
VRVRATSEPALPYESLEQIWYRLLEEQDTDCDQKISIADQGNRRLRFRLQGQAYEFEGAHVLSNVLEELSLARRTSEAPRLDRVSEDPIARLSRRIRTDYWMALTRRLDEDGLPALLDDPKLPRATRERVLYVPNDDERAYAYFRAVAERYDRAYAALARATAGAGASELLDAELTVMLKSAEGRENLAELARRTATAVQGLDYPGLRRHLMGALGHLGELLEQAGRSCVNGDESRVSHLAERVRAALSSVAPKTLAVRKLPDASEWLEWSGRLGEAHGLLSLALEDKGGAVHGVPFIVPGGRESEMYGWDSHFILRGLIADERLDLARGLVENAAYVIEHYGATLNANRTYYLTRSQPPFFASMLRAYWEALPREARDRRWLARMLRAAVREYDDAWTQPPRRSSLCRGPEGERACLAHYAGLGRGQPPEVEPGHYDWLWRDLGRSLEQTYQAGRLRERDLAGELDTAFTHDRCMRESGHDTTYRWFWARPEGGKREPRAENRCADVLTVDLNSLLYRYEVDVASLLSELGAPLPAAPGPRGEPPAAPFVPEPNVWCARARHRFELMKKYLWSARDGLFYDVLLDAGRPIQTRYVSATTLYPLWATARGCLDVPPPRDLTAAERSLLVTNALAQLEAPGGLLASAKSSRDRFSTESDRQWDYPNGWAPHQMLAWDALDAHGFRQDAERLISSWLFMIVSNAIDHAGTVAEKYDVVERTHAVFSEYGNQGADFDYITTEGFGWMNASFEVGLARLGPDARRRLSQSLSVR